ncbi:MAG TPA: FAD:protein FMN transferase [Thermodesulfovibrionales bacterium]|nr:FAD:protein FMN transferase [Thermodesulfovibrionales bacterium]
MMRGCDFLHLKFMRGEGIARIFLIAVLCLLMTLLISCSRGRERVFRKSKILMDTIVTISVAAESEDKAEKAIESGFAEIDRLDRMLSFFSESSELSRINRNAGVAPVSVSPETLEVMQRALYTSAKTGGAFDVTIGPESSQWDFYKKKKPDDDVIRERLSLVDYRQIQINGIKSTIFLPKKGMLADLGGIAKGYAADRAVEEMKRRGIRAGLVAVAGDIRAFGRKPGGSGWKVGIRNPRAKGKDDEIMATMELDDMAISTSGDYERYFIVDGERYHHILDPKTGYPARGCRSVTVVARDGVNTDSFSTGVFVLGPEKGLGVLKEMGFDGVIVDSDGGIETTPGLRNRIEFQRHS